MRFLDLAHETVRFLLGHLSTTNHVLHEIASAFHGKGGETGCRANHILHG